MEHEQELNLIREIRRLTKIRTLTNDAANQHKKISDNLYIEGERLQHQINDLRDQLSKLVG